MHNHHMRTSVGAENQRKNKKDNDMIYLISPDKKQYKANLHCHSTLSDGKKRRLS